MKNTTRITCDFGGQTMVFEAGLLAQQAAGSVTITLGESTLFSAVTTKAPRDGIDYFPLQVEYREKFYAAGRFPGGYFKREARPSEKEILTARVTDRPIRSLFPEGFHDEVQINNMVLSADGENDTDILSVNAASAALTLSELPFAGPVGAVRVARIDGAYVLNPTHTQRAESDLDLFYCGTRDKFMMMEGSAAEIAEADMIAAMQFGHEAVIKLIDAQLELRRAMGKQDKVIPTFETPKALVAKMKELAGDDMLALLNIADKTERQNGVSALRARLKEQLVAALPDMSEEDFFQGFDAFEIQTVRDDVMENNHRVGGRGLNELRELYAEVSLLPRPHGTALFSRGETQALCTCTLGTARDSQSMDGVVGGPTDKKFILHYNFPPYSVGEAGRLGSTSRREIGHGNLAERSIEPMMPREYPYSVRLVSDIMGSNGSSSMASICAGSLALMDAGVPIKKPVAGISIGLFTAGDRFKLVTDILGVEDHCGDMDFKVGGTRDGITGFQVDLKIGGLTWEQVTAAFEAARAARMDILDYMATVLPEPRAELSRYAPRIEVVQIPVDKIGALIGPGGKNIRRLTDTYDAEIDIAEDGKVSIFSSNGDDMAAVKAEIEGLTAEAEEGKIYKGRVTGVKDFGAFVEILPGMEGLVHISELADYRVKSTEDICKMGDPMWVKVLSVEDNGKIRLSRRAAMEEMDEPTDSADKAE